MRWGSQVHELSPPWEKSVRDKTRTGMPFPGFKLLHRGNREGKFAELTVMGDKYIGNSDRNLTSASWINA